MPVRGMKRNNNQNDVGLHSLFSPMSWWCQESDLESSLISIKGPWLLVRVPHPAPISLRRRVDWKSGGPSWMLDAVVCRTGYQGRVSTGLCFVDADLQSPFHPPSFDSVALKSLGTKRRKDCGAPSLSACASCYYWHHCCSKFWGLNLCYHSVLGKGSTTEPHSFPLRLLPTFCLFFIYLTVSLLLPISSFWAFPWAGASLPFSPPPQLPSSPSGPWISELLSTWGHASGPMLQSALEEAVRGEEHDPGAMQDAPPATRGGAIVSSSNKPLTTQPWIILLHISYHLILLGPKTKQCKAGFP